MARVANRELLVLRYTEARDAGKQSSCRALRGALVAAYRGELTKIARSWTRSISGARYDLDDLLQESAIVLLRLLDVQGVRDFDNALRVSVRHRFRDIRRGELRRETTSTDGFCLHARIDGAYMRSTAAPAHHAA